MSRRSTDTYAWTAPSARGGGAPRHRSSIMRSRATTRLASRSSMASRARCLGGPSSIGVAPSCAATGPRIVKRTPTLSHHNQRWSWSGTATVTLARAKMPAWNRRQGESTPCCNASRSRPPGASRRRRGRPGRCRRRSRRLDVEVVLVDFDVETRDGKRSGIGAAGAQLFRTDGEGAQDAGEVHDLPNGDLVRRFVRSIELDPQPRPAVGRNPEAFVGGHGDNGDCGGGETTADEHGEGGPGREGLA